MSDNNQQIIDEGDDDVVDGKTKSNQNNNKKKEKKKKKKKSQGKKVVLFGIKSRKKNGCCLGMKQRLESCSESPTSDPNSSDFTFDSLRGLIENSDFFLDECNTHLNV